MSAIERIRRERVVAILRRVPMSTIASPHWQRLIEITIERARARADVTVLAGTVRPSSRWMPGWPQEQKVP